MMFHKKKLLEKRKREEQEQTPQSIDTQQPSTKKIKTSPPKSPITPQTPRTPAFTEVTNHVTKTRLEQRKNLTAKVRTQERELKELHHVLATTDKRLKHYQDTVDFMNKIWNNMVEDLEITMKLLPYPISSSIQTATTTTSSGKSLISHYSTCSDLDASNCNLAMIEQRCDQTRQFMNLIVENIIHSNKKFDETVTQLKQTNNTSDFLREENERLKGRTELLEEQFAIMQNNYREACDKQEKLTLKSQRLESELESKKTECDDLKFELRQARQKIDKLTLDLQEGGTLLLNGTSNSQSRETTSEVHTSGDDKTKVQDMEVQIQELTKILNNRDGQIAEKIEQISKLQQENQKLKTQMTTESHIVQTAPYKQMFTQYQQQLFSLEQEQTAKTDLMAKVEDLKKLHAEELMQAKSAFENVISGYQDKENSLSADVTRLKQTLVEKEMLLKEESEKASKVDAAFKKCDDLQKRLEKKRKDFENLMKDHEKLKRAHDKLERQIQSAQAIQQDGNGWKPTSDVETMRKELLATKEELQDKIEETQMYVAELEEVSASFSKMQEQTAKQKKQLDSKEERITELLRELIEMKRINDAHEMRINSMKQKYETNLKQVTELTEQVQQYQQKAEAIEQLSNMKQQEIAKLQLNFEKVRGLLKLKETKITTLASEVERSKRALDAATVRADETQTKYNKSSNEAKIQKEKVETLEKRLKVLSSQGPSKDVENELTDLKRMVICSVCQTRNKNVTIGRCSHTFCSECIQSNLKVRNRKCPICGEKFGHDDVHSIFL